MWLIPALDLKMSSIWYGYDDANYLTPSLCLLSITNSYAPGPRKVSPSVIVAIDQNSLSYIQSNTLSVLSLAFWECSHRGRLWRLYIYPRPSEFPPRKVICKITNQRCCMEGYFLRKRNWRILFHQRGRARSEPKVGCVANIKDGAGRSAHTGYYASLGVCRWSLLEKNVFQTFHCHTSVDTGLLSQHQGQPVSLASKLLSLFLLLQFCPWLFPVTHAF